MSYNPCRYSSKGCEISLRSTIPRNALAYGKAEELSKKLMRNRYPAGSQRIAVNEASPDKTLRISIRERASNVRSRFFMAGDGISLVCSGL